MIFLTHGLFKISYSHLKLLSFLGWGIIFKTLIFFLKLAEFDLFLLYLLLNLNEFEFEIFILFFE